MRTKKSSKKQSPREELIEERRKLAEADLAYFIELVQPKRLLGNVHRELISWYNRQERKSHQMVLLPRDHGKSAFAGFVAAWELTRDPTLRILYISSTSNLATKQLKFIKDILTCDNYRIHWPAMVNREEANREKWTEREISIDDPRRKAESIRDPSIFTAGLTTNIVGLHSDITIMDDVVVTNNAYTEDGREKVKDQYSLLSSIEGTNARELIVGTRYHPDDLYGELLNKKVERYNELGEIIESNELFEVFERQVESIGDGTGEFLWPRQQRFDGKWFGFNAEILATKKSQYSNQVYFRAQYYNDPHDSGSSVFSRNNFQYYDSAYLARRDGRILFKGEQLNVFAAVDFAFSLARRADYTSIVVVGVDGKQNYYILEIDRFKTDKISEYFNRILKLYQKWGFRKIRTEVTSAQQVIVKDLKENYIRPHGLSLVVDEFKPSIRQGSKEERIMAILEPKYANRQVWHYVGGNCQVLEEELLFANPPHDDVKDALASVVDFAIAPVSMFNTYQPMQQNFEYHSRFGGVM